MSLINWHDLLVYSLKCTHDPEYKVEVKDPFMLVDNTGKNYDGNIYVTWMSAQGFLDGTMVDSVLFSRSTNGGATYSSSPIILDHSNIGRDSLPLMPRIAIGPNGEVYVAWDYHHLGERNGKMKIAKSTNGGASFQAPLTSFNPETCVKTVI